MTFLIEEIDYAIILQTNIEIPKEKPLTIISIRGTTNILDIWLDTELFITLILFSLSRRILFKLENSLSSLYYSTLSIRNLENLILTKKYVEGIEKIIEQIKLEPRI